MISRRGLLFGVGAVVLTAGAAAYKERRYVREVIQDGCIVPPFPPPHARNASVDESDGFHSRVLGKRVGVTIVRAVSEHDGGESRIVVFALPGRGATAHDQVFGLHLPDYLGAAAARFGRSMTLVAVDGGESYWHPRRSGENRMRMLLEEVVLPMRSKYERIGIMGWSMGAYGAMLAAQSHPRLFSAVCADSVALWRDAREQQAAVPDAFDDTADFERHDILRGVSTLRKTRVRIACGTSDPFYPADRALVSALRADGQSPEVHFAAGCHDGAFWQRSAPDDFAFLMSTLDPTA